MTEPQSQFEPESNARQNHALFPRSFVQISRCLLKLAVLGLAFATILSIIPAIWWVFALFEHPRPIYVVASLLLIVLATWIRAWPWVFITAAVLMTNVVLLERGFKYEADPAHRTNLTVTHLNLDRDNQNTQAVLDFIQNPSTQTQIVCLQELTPKWENDLRQQLTDYEWIVSKPRDDSRGVGMLLHKQAVWVEIDEVSVLHWLPERTDRPTLAVTFRINDETGEYNQDRSFTLLSLHTRAGPVHF